MRVYALDAQDKPGLADGTEYAIDTPQLHLELIFSHHEGPLQLTPGLSDEACVQILLDRLVKLLHKENCDAYRKALYHLVKAKECFLVHRHPSG